MERTPAPRGNGKELEDSRLVLTLNQAEFTMTIGGTVDNYDQALAMLSLAKREIKAQLRARRTIGNSPLVTGVSRLFVNVRQ